jgi:hypothetical protein
MAQKGLQFISVCDRINTYSTYLYQFTYHDILMENNTVAGSYDAAAA